jgi:5-methylcytosine-specific restriction endonuclease McrA
MQIKDDLDKTTNEFIHFLFLGRCLVCGRPGSDVNEIVPRSRGKASMDWHNRVLLCRSCHSLYHLMGASAKAIADMQSRRRDFLVSTGREEYV